MEELVFISGTWRRITLPFSDPILSAGDRRFAAAIVAKEMARGASQQQAEQVAEAATYARLYPGLKGRGD